MTAKLYLEVVDETQPAASAGFGVGGITQGPLEAHAAAERLSAFFAGMAGGALPGVIRVRTDTPGSTRATLAVTVDYDVFTAGDRLVLVLPTGEIAFTGIASGTPVAGDGTFSFATSDNATAASLAQCINTDFRCIRLGITASPSSAVCTISAPAGSYANLYYAVVSVTSGTPFSLANSGAFAGGHDAGAPNPTLTFTITDKVSLDDTLTLGTVVLTAKASPANENQFVGHVSQDADGAALAACINAHSKLRGIFSAAYGAPSSGIITITFVPTGRIAYQTVLAKSCSVGTLSATTFVPVTVDTYGTAMVQYDLGRTPA